MPMGNRPGYPNGCCVCFSRTQLQPAFQGESEQVSMVQSVADVTLLILAVENAELRIQLAESQDQCVKLAVDAGELNTKVEALRARLVVVERDRDRWRTKAEFSVSAAVA